MAPFSSSFADVGDDLDAHHAAWAITTIIDGMRLLKRREESRVRINEGIDQLEHGESIDEETVFDQRQQFEKKNRVVDQSQDFWRPFAFLARKTG